MNKTLKEILKDKLTDKATDHSYGEVYETLFESRRHSAKKVLEIGICFGGSMLAWYEYFTSAIIYGLDIMYNRHVLELPKNDRLRVLMSDAYDPYVYDAISKHKYDVIIDDGPHTLKSMKFTAANYSKILSDDGILIIEDIQDEKWIDEIKMEFPDEYKDKVKVYDLRHIKNRYDDILIVMDKSSI